jgi:glutamyl-tRNA synthetase
MRNRAQELIMEKSHIRVRFAPSPTGFMHLGNVRAALLNYLFARQKNGTFIIRVEDTDPQRNIDLDAKNILADLAWLKLDYDEGPVNEGPSAPYFQSKRTSIYQAALSTLQQKHLIYPCFCSTEELEHKRKRQLALKMPPRYDRTCMKLSENEVKAKFEENTPYIWRFKLDQDKTVSFFDLAHKSMHFELQHFSDVALTRQDGSFTFIFANFIDDVAMKITHVFRGEDHLTNTAVQVALYEAFEEEIPVFWHLPILCNLDGKKLSKRDFGFSLNDLKYEGFLPEALENYLGIIGRSVSEEIMDRKELIESYNFDHLSTTGQIKYDVEKLHWVNHQWIMRYDLDELTELCRPFIKAENPKLGNLSHEELKKLIAPLQPELVTLKQSVKALSFITEEVIIDPVLLDMHQFGIYRSVLKQLLPQLVESTPEDAYDLLKRLCTEKKYPMKDIFTLIRVGLTGKAKGLGIKELFSMLPKQEIEKRLQQLLR